MPSTAHRAVRASILEDRSKVSSNGCSLAGAGNYVKFASQNSRLATLASFRNLLLSLAAEPPKLRQPGMR